MSSENKLALDSKKEVDVIEKVDRFLEENPVCPMFIKKEKGRLPYSVFKPHS